MQINGVAQERPVERGHVLLLAGGATGRRRSGVHRPAANLAALAAAPVPALLGSTVAADVVQLLDEAEPQALLARLRTAAAAPGPLVIYLSGRLTTDRRQNQPHLALTGTTALTVRYTALPWWWLRHELRLRPTARTTVFADLTADAPAWRRLSEDPALLADGLPLYGVVTPPDTPADGAATPYTRHLSELLRHSRTPPPPAELHHLAAAHSRIGQAALWYAAAPAAAPATVPAPASAPAPPPVAAADGTRAVMPGQAAEPPRDPHEAIWRAAQAGRHTEAAAMAAAWEEYALRTAGPDSDQARHWLEIRADLARRAGDHVRATELCIAVARDRLRHHAPGAPGVSTAVDNAHHCWERVTDPGEARRLAPGLIALREAVPGPGDRLLQAARRRLGQLAAERTATEGGARPQAGSPSVAGRA